MVGIQIGKEQEERKREEEGLNFETTPWWNFRNHHGLCGRRAAEREFVKFVKLRAQPTAKAKAKDGIRPGGAYKASVYCTFHGTQHRASVYCTLHSTQHKASV